MLQINCSKKIIVFIFVIAFLIKEGLAATKPEVYFCIQVCSSRKKELALKIFDKVKHYPQARVEKIGDFYTVRVGLAKEKTSVYSLFKDIKKKFKDAFIRTCSYIPSRIIALPPQKVPKVAKLTGLKPQIKPEVYFCIQICSSQQKKFALEIFNKVKHYPQARVEKIGDFYTVRVGLAKEKPQIYSLLKKVKKRFKDAFIRTCYYIPSRIVTSPRITKVSKPPVPKKKIQKIEVKEIKPVRLKEKIEKKKVVKKEVTKPALPPRPKVEAIAKPSPKQMEIKEKVKLIEEKREEIEVFVKPPPRLPKGVLGVIPKPRVIIFPVSNLSESSNIPEKEIINYWTNFFKKRGFQVLLPEDIKNFLYVKRIRNFYYLSSTLAQELGQKFGAKAIVLSWLDAYNPKIPEIGIGIRVIDTKLGEVFWTNYVILRGDDFRSWFGLGEIKDEKKLMRIAVKRLFKDFPSTFVVHNKKQTNVITGITAPLLEKFSLRPDIVKGGSPVDITMRLIAPQEMCRRVAVLIGSREAFLEKKSPLWKGQITAPQKEGFYFTKIKIWDKRGIIHFINTGVVLTVDNTPPKLKISIENPIFSPNRDGIKDSVIFFPFLLEPEKIDKWAFLIYDKNGDLIRSYEGSGDLPKAWAWHGEDNEVKNVKDGSYYFECVVQDKAGNVTVPQQMKIIVDRNPPKISISFVPKDNQGKKGLLQIRCTDENEIKDWALSILDKNGRIVKLFVGDNQPPKVLRIELPAPIKEYYLLTEVKDVAGNLSKLKLPLSIKGEIRSEQKKEEVKKQHVEWNYDF